MIPDFKNKTPEVPAVLVLGDNQTERIKPTLRERVRTIERLQVVFEFLEGSYIFSLLRTGFPVVCN